MVDRPSNTPNGAVMRVTHFINLGVEPKTSTTRFSQRDPHRLPVNLYCQYLPHNLNFDLYQSHKRSNFPTYVRYQRYLI